MKAWLPTIGYSLMILVYGGTIIGWLAKNYPWRPTIGYSLIFTVYAGIIIGWLVRKSLRAKEQTPSDSTPSPEPAHPVIARKWVPVTTYLFGQELAVIGTIGLILNFVGLAVSKNVWSVLYLDMTGTAVVAFLLGPWWGAVVGTLSNSLLDWFLFPEQTYATFLPWTLVNMAGGLLWGFWARRPSFRKNIQSTETKNTSHLSYLFKFGVLASFFMSIVGVAVQAVLGEKTKVSFDPRLAAAIDRLVNASQHWLLGPLAGKLGRLGELLSWALPVWLQTWLRFIPDKTISAAIALAIIRYGLPVFRNELTLGGSGNKPPRDSWIGPVALGLAYLPSFVYFIQKYWSSWPLWSCPFLIVGFGLVQLLGGAPSNSEVIQARKRRLETYSKVYRGRDGTIRFRDDYGLWFGTTVASGFFLLSLPVLGVSIPDFYRITVNFFLVVFGFFLAVQLIFIVGAQKLGVSDLSEEHARPTITERSSRPSAPAGPATPD